jgi:hypothetical protein
MTGLVEVGAVFEGDSIFEEDSELSVPLGGF